VGTLAERGSGAVATRDGRLVGFQAAMLLDGRGGRWAWTPDVGHALAEDEDPRTIEALYARLADAWVRQACAEHVVTLLADDAPGIETFGRLGFGQHVIDLVRDLGPVAGAGCGGAIVGRVGPDAAAVITDLDLGLRRHLSASPIFQGLGPARSLELQRRELADSAVATFVATSGDAPLAFLRIGPVSDDVAMLVRDEGTASITGAFTLADHRGAGIATDLLDAAIGWARAQGYARCAVDHESANREAGRFWARHFSPVAVSLSRRLPARVLP
jgi:GNAT superfamily N-acetyltransferase